MGLFSRNKRKLTLEEKIEKSIQVYFDYFQNPNKINRQIAKIADTEDEYMQLYLFLPMAFCREFVPEVEYSDIYITSDNGTDKENRFSESNIYSEITRVVKKNWANFSGENLMKVLFHSGDFKAINESLKNGAKPEDLKSVPARIV